MNLMLLAMVWKMHQQHSKGLQIKFSGLDFVFTYSDDILIVSLLSCNYL